LVPEIFFGWTDLDYGLGWFGAMFRQFYHLLFFMTDFLLRFQLFFQRFSDAMMASSFWWGAAIVEQEGFVLGSFAKKS